MIPHEKPLLKEIYELISLFCSQVEKIFFAKVGYKLKQLHTQKKQLPGSF